MAQSNYSGTFPLLFFFYDIKM